MLKKCCLKKGNILRVKGTSRAMPMSHEQREGKKTDIANWENLIGESGSREERYNVK